MPFDPLRLRRRFLAVFGMVVLGAMLQAACSAPTREFGSPEARAPGGDAGTSSSAGAGGTRSSGSSGASGTKNNSSGGSDMTEAAGAPGTAGNSGACTTVTDCPDAPNECAQPTCSDGQCGLDYAKSGVLAGTQVAGDCHKTICDGKGALTTVADDTDLPVDGNACTLDVCKNGVASNPNAPSTTACGATSQFKCDGKGSCASCAVDADCGQNNICATFKCTAGACKTTFLQGDPGQTAGDCKKNICTNGSLTATVDTTDVPVDGKVCTTDLCSANGAPSNPPVAATTACGPSSQCDANGNCVCNDPNACTGKCGTFNDACGHSVNCGGCTAAHQTCGGGGTPNVCGCSPSPVCHDHCGGTVADGCGGTFVCDASNECTCNEGCTPVCGGDVCQCAGFCG